MNIERNKSHRAFTLVELIVVIAIISILAAVFIPSFSRLIDRGRFSNDTQVAASMTSILKAHLASGVDDELDAFDVIDIIEENNGGTFDFTPLSVNTGYFYLENSQRIVALKYEDASEFDDGEALGHPFEQTNLLSDQDIDIEPDFYSPAELFGKGKHLMTRDGSPIAQAVDLIYQLANSGSIVDRLYEYGYDTFEDYSDGLIARIIGIGISQTLKDSVAAMLTYYDPATTLYVNEVAWETGATVNGTITKIVMAPGISNIPANNIDSALIDHTFFTSLQLPRTVRTIEKDAFTVFSGLENITLKGSSVVAIEEGATEGINVTFQTKDLSEVDLGVLYPGLSSITYDQTLDIQMGDFQDDMVDLGNEITGFRIEIYLQDQESSRIYVYTPDGLIGYVVPEYIEN
jgi:prepilin-type N-terminal cleavage/methylation domain-containing protein